LLTHAKLATLVAAFLITTTSRGSQQTRATSHHAIYQPLPQGNGQYRSHREKVFNFIVGAATEQLWQFV
ncbi:hypothetical protein Q4595_27220, partial [Wenyingzhuangia sp. 1_MG-2023]|nr:hypothetical protein [Wenyingzhuangia sp. 1_MG-2023]